MSGAAVMSEKPKNDKKRKDTAVKIEDDLAQMVSTMCSYRRVPIASYLSPIIRAKIESDFAAFIRERAKNLPR